jgi:hypothetical protein
MPSSTSSRLKHSGFCNTHEIHITKGYVLPALTISLRHKVE